MKCGATCDARIDAEGNVRRASTWPVAMLLAITTAVPSARAEQLVRRATPRDAVKLALEDLSRVE